MGRGRGWLQARILEVISDGPEEVIDSMEIAGRVFNKRGLTASEAVSTRRSLRALAKKGVIDEMGRKWFRDGRRRWGSPEKVAKLKLERGPNAQPTIKVEAGRSNQEKRDIVTAYLKSAEHQDLTQAKIARICGVSTAYVCRVRGQIMRLQPEIEMERLERKLEFQRALIERK